MRTHLSHQRIDILYYHRYLMVSGLMCGLLQIKRLESLLRSCTSYNPLGQCVGACFFADWDRGLDRINMHIICINTCIYILLYIYIHMHVFSFEYCILLYIIPGSVCVSSSLSWQFLSQQTSHHRS